MLQSQHFNFFNVFEELNEFPEPKNKTQINKFE